MDEESKLDQPQSPEVEAIVYSTMAGVLRALEARELAIRPFPGVFVGMLPGPWVDDPAVIGHGRVFPET